MICPICERETVANLISTYREYKLYHCAICDSMFWLPLKSIPGESYDSDNVAGALTYMNLRAIPWAHKRFFEDLPNKDGKLLEIGCSSGEFLEKAHKAGYSVTGIDSAPQNIEFAKSNYELNNVFPFTVQELMIRQPEEKYDVIAFFQVLEHIDDVPDFINCIKKLLKPDGIVVVSVPNRDRWRVKSERFFREVWDLPPCHLTRWNASALEKVFAGYGFSITLAEVEPSRLYERAWSNFISQKLGINRLAEKFAGKTVGKQSVNLSATKRNNLRKTVAGIAGALYLKIFFPLLTALTLPLKLIVTTKQGRTIYFLASLQNTEEE